MPGMDSSLGLSPVPGPPKLGCNQAALEKDEMAMGYNVCATPLAKTLDLGQQCTLGHIMEPLLASIPLSTDSNNTIYLMGL